MTARSSKCEYPSIFSSESCLCFRVRETRHLRFSLDPLNFSFGIQKFYKALRSIAYDGDLEGVLAVVLLGATVRDVNPSGYENARWLEVEVIMEVVLDAFFRLDKDVSFVGFSIVDCARLCGVHVGVERSNGWIW